MNRLAIFVEGNTEVIFVKKIIEEIAGRNKIYVEQGTIRGGATAPRSLTIKASNSINNNEYYVLILDCGNDKLVKTRILEEHENFTQKGYSKIIGLRDVRPDFTYSDIPKLEMALQKYVKTKFIPVEFVLSVMEIEAWFLAETSHFQKVSPNITLELIKSTLGFDPENDDMGKRPTPTQDLDNCYRIGEKSYSKRAVSSTINKLDYALMYLHFGNKDKYFKRLVKSIDAFLS